MRDKAVSVINPTALFYVEVHVRQFFESSAPQKHPPDFIARPVYFLG